MNDNRTHPARPLAGRLGTVFAGLAVAALVAATPSPASAQTRDRGARYQRATGGSGSSGGSSSSSAARSQSRSATPNRSRAGSADRSAFTRGQFDRPDGGSRTRTDSNTRFNRPATPSDNARAAGSFRDAGRTVPQYRGADLDRGDRYQRARVAGGRDYGSTADYRRYDNGRGVGYDRFRYAQPYGYGAYGSSYYRSAYRPYYGYGAGYGTGLSLGFAFRDDFPGRYNNAYDYDRYYGGSYGGAYYNSGSYLYNGLDRYEGGYGGVYRGGYDRGYDYRYDVSGDAFGNDSFHVPDGYVAPGYYYYRSYRYTPVYRPQGYVPRYNYRYDYAPAYGGSYDGFGAAGTYRYGGYDSFLSSSFGFGYSSAATDYRPFAFGCAPRTSVSYGLSYSTGGTRYYPRYSYAPAYGTSVNVGVQYRSR